MINFFCFSFFAFVLLQSIRSSSRVDHNKKMKWSCVILFAILNVADVLGQESYCYADDGDKKQTKHYSTKTPYEVARGSDRKYFTVPSMSSLIDFESNLHFDNLFLLRNFLECEPVKFWILSRHGTRNPSEKSIAALSQLTDVSCMQLQDFLSFDSYQF